MTADYCLIVDINFHFSTYLEVIDGLHGTKLQLCGFEMKGRTLQSSMYGGYMILTRNSVGNPFKIRLETVKGNICIGF